MSQRDVLTILQKALDYIVEGLAKGKNIELRNFGVFEVQVWKARIGRNPKNPTHVVTIPSRKVVKFKMGRVMKARITKARTMKSRGMRARGMRARGMRARGMKARIMKNVR